MNFSREWDGLTKSIEDSNVANRYFRLKSLEDLHEQDINEMSVLTERNQQQRQRTASSSDNDASSGIFQNTGRRGAIRGPSEFWKWISSKEITRKYLETKQKIVTDSWRMASAMRNMLTLLTRDLKPFYSLLQKCFWTKGAEVFVCSPTWWWQSKKDCLLHEMSW